MESDLVIINADCFYDFSIVKSIIESNGNFIAIDSKTFNEESMKVRIDDFGNIIEMSKLLKNIEKTFVSIDIYSFSLKNRIKLFDIISGIIKKGELNSWTEVGIDLLAKDSDSKIKVLDFRDKRWMEIDNHDDLKKAEKIFGI